MSFAAPIWLVIAGFVAAAVVAAHLITPSQPRRDVLPTARFIPQVAPMTVTRARRPTDLLLLLTRLAAVLLLGLALAGAHVTRRAPARVIIADVSRSVADRAAVRDTVRAMAGNDAVVIGLGDSAGPATLSGALVAAHRAIAARSDGDRTELVIVSPIAREQVDSATPALMALWPGRVRVSRARAASPTLDTGVRITRVVARGDDPVTAALALSTGAGRARVFRSALPTPADTAWARDSGGALVVWPADHAARGLARRAIVDTQHGIAAGGNVVIGAFARSHAPSEGRAVVRWLDGEPAATELPLGAGCLREVAIPVDAAGDIALRESFRGIAATLTSPCGGPRDLAPADLAALLPTGESRQPLRAMAAAVDTERLALWLGLAALTALLVEQLLRRRQRA